MVAIEKNEYNSMHEEEKVRLIRDLIKTLTKFEEELISGFARNEGQMEIEHE